MKKVITSDKLKDIEKLLGSKGVKTGGAPLTDALSEKVKNHKIA